MHNCPNCGSDRIQLLPEKNSKLLSNTLAGAVIGEALFGDIGGLIGGFVGANVSSQSLEVNYCVNCGNKWNAEQLFEIVMCISRLLNRELNLSSQLDRQALSEFIKLIPPAIAALERRKQEYPIIIAKAKESISMSHTFLNLINYIGFFFGVLFISVGILNKSYFLLSLAGFVILALSLYLRIYSAYDLRLYRQKNQAKAALSAEVDIQMAQENLDNIVDNFKDKYQSNHVYRM
jgi:small-conductance mechanosensitive channel